MKSTEQFLNMKIFYYLSRIVLIFFIFNGTLLSSQTKKVIENIDYIYMHIGLQMDYSLPENFKNEKLKFEGNYKRYTSAVYRKSNNDIRFTPKRSGSAVMIIKNKKNQILGRLNIDIQKDNLHKIAAELRDLLIAVDGIEVKIYNKKVIIDGQVLLPREMDRVKAVMSQYKEHLVQSLVTYSPEAQKKIAEIIEKEIGYPELTVRYAYNRFLLEGCVSTKAEERRALSIASLYIQFDVSAVVKGRRDGVPLIKNELTVPCESEKKADSEKKKKQEIKKLIQIVVHFVEMEKNFHKGFLFQWAPTIGDNGTQVTSSIGNNPATPSGITAVLTATVRNFFPKLNWAKSFSFARVLHNSSLLVEEKEKGKISTSISVPDKTLQDGTQVGGGQAATVSTEVRPEIIGDRSNLIKMKVLVVVASPTSEGISRRDIDTTIHVRDGSSAVIGGVISSFLNRGYNKDPGASEGPPIINLLSKKDYNTSKSQFVVFITPLIKSSSSIGVERIKKKFKLHE